MATTLTYLDGPRRRLFAPHSRALATATVGMPAILTIILSLVAGGLQVVSGIVLNSSPQWQVVVTLLITTLAGFGIQPLIGSKFAAALENLLHLPYSALLVIGAVLTLAAGVVQVIPMSQFAHIVIITVLTILSALGFGTAPAQVMPPAPTPPPPPPSPPSPPVAAHRRPAVRREQGGGLTP